MRERGFINVLVALSLIVVTFVGLWSMEYIRRIRLEREFQRNVDRLTLEASSYQAAILNSVAITNDVIIGGDLLAGVVASLSTVVGIFTLQLEVVSGGLQLAKDIIEVIDKIQKIQKSLVEASPFISYIPYASFYSANWKGLNKGKQIFLPYPFIPSFNYGESRGGNSSILEKFQLKLYLTWNPGKVAKGLLKEVIEVLKREAGAIDKEEKVKLEKESRKIAGRKCKKICRKKGAGLKSVEGECTKKLGSVTEKFSKKLYGVLVKALSKAAEKLYSKIDSWDPGKECKILGMEIPVPAVLEDNFYQKQRIGTLGIWINKEKPPLSWLEYRSKSKIPVEIGFSRAMPYSSADNGDVPIVPDWKGVFVPPDLIDAIGGSNGKR